MVYLYFSHVERGYTHCSYNNVESEFHFNCVALDIMISDESIIYIKHRVMFISFFQIMLSEKCNVNWTNDQTCQMAKLDKCVYFALLRRSQAINTLLLR